MRWIKTLSLCFVALLISAATPMLSIELENADIIRRFFGVTSDYVNHKNLPRVRVAILAKGFGDLSVKPGDAPYYLPPTYTLHTWDEVPGVPELDPDDSSGLRMAMAIWAICGKSWEIAPTFELYNANSLQGFELSHRDAARVNADIVVSLTNYNTFSNFDGSGGINPLPERLVRDSESFWIHSAGDMRHAVRHGSLNAESLGLTTWSGTKGNWFKQHSNGNPFLRFKVNRSVKRIKITLTWNAFPPYLSFQGKDKDVDLVVFRANAEGNPVSEIARSSKRQVVSPTQGTSETTVPYEEVTLDRVGPSENFFLIGLQHVNGTFDSGDHYTLTVKPSLRIIAGEDPDKIEADRKAAEEKAKKQANNPDAQPEKKDEKPPAVKYHVDFTDESPDGSLMPPADNPQAFVVGDYSRYSGIGPTRKNAEGKSIARPELILDAVSMQFTDGSVLSGADAATVIFAALSTMMKAVNLNLKPHEYRQIVANQKNRFALTRPFEEPSEIDTRLKESGWTIGEEDKGKLLKDYTDFMSVGPDKLGGIGAAIKKDTSDSHLRLGFLSHPLTLQAFSTHEDDEKKYDSATRAFYVYVSGTGKSAKLQTWVGPSTEKPWTTKGGKATDYFEIVDLSFPSLDYSKAYLRSKRFQMPKQSELETLQGKK